MPDSGKAKPTPLHDLLGWKPPAEPHVPHAVNGHEAAPDEGPDTDDGVDHDDERDDRAEPRIAIVDGSNVAHQGEGHGARLANILAVRDKLRGEGYDPVIVVDAALRHQIDDAAGYERLVATGMVKQAPAGTDADYFILSFAKHLDAAIVSNDQFRDRSRQFAEVRRNVIRYMVVANEVVFERRTSRRR